MEVEKLFVVAICLIIVASMSIKLMGRTKEIYYGVKSIEWPTVDGTIISSEIIIEKDPADWDNVTDISVYQVEYQYWIEGRKFTNNLINFDSTKYKKRYYRHIKEPTQPVEEDIQQLFPLDSKIHVYYHPKDPRISVLEPGHSLEPKNFVVFIIFIIFILFSIYLLYKIISS